MKRTAIKSNPATQRAWEQRTRDKAWEKDRVRHQARPEPPELRAARKVVYARSGRLCEARTSECTGRAKHVHHRAGRDWVGCHDDELLLDCCFACHQWIHAHPKVALPAGWLVNKARAKRGDYGLASRLA